MAEANFNLEQLAKTEQNFHQRIAEIQLSIDAITEATNNISNNVLSGNNVLSQVWSEIATTYSSITNKLNENVERVRADLTHYIDAAKSYDATFAANVTKLSEQMDDFESKLAAL